MATVKGNPECKECELYRSAQAVCLMGRGPIPSDIMVIGEAPGFREDEIGKPFQGKAGQLLDKLLNDVGIKRKDCYITNICKCRPPNNKTPTNKQMKACREYLEREIQEVKPKYVLLLGATALKGAINKAKITENHGVVYELNGIKYLPTFHPAAALRDPKRLDPLRNDLERFAKVVEGMEIDDGPHLNWCEVKSFEQFNACLADIEASPVVSFDLETTGLEWWVEDFQINCMGIATPNGQWVIPFGMKGSRFKKYHTQKLMVELIEGAMEGKKVVTHNGKYDNLCLRSQYGIRFPITFDTMQASHLVDENSPNGLEYLARVIFKAPNYGLSTPEKKGNTKPKRLYKYCALDVYYTLKLYYYFKRKLQADKATLKIFKHLIMPAAIVFEDIEEEGVYVLEDKLAKVEKDLLKKIEKVTEKLNEFTKKEEVNWNSNQQVAEIVFGEWGLSPVKITDTGQPSTAEDILKRLAKESEGVDLLLEYRGHHKQWSSFIKGWKKRMMDGRLHPSFKLHGTVTGRLSCTNPNLQQVPRDSSIRSLIGAPPGWTFVQADYSQVELRVAAMLAGENTMKRIFQTGGDVHTETAKSLIGKHEVEKEERKKAKAVNFGFLYGMGAPKFQDYAQDKYGVKLSMAESKKYRTRFFEKYSDLTRWHEKQRRIARSFGQVRSLIGRLRRLPEVYSPDRKLKGEAERNAINAPVQGLASDITLIALVEIRKRFSWDVVKIIGSVHDSVLLVIKDEYLEEVLPKIKKIMEDPPMLKKKFKVNLPIPLVVDIEVGNWGSGKEWELKKKSSKK